MSQTDLSFNDHRCMPQQTIQEGIDEIRHLLANLCDDVLVRCEHHISSIVVCVPAVKTSKSLLSSIWGFCANFEHACKFEVETSSVDCVILSKQIVDDTPTCVHVSHDTNMCAHCLHVPVCPDCQQIAHDPFCNLHLPSIDAPLQWGYDLSIHIDLGQGLEALPPWYTVHRIHEVCNVVLHSQQEKGGIMRECDCSCGSLRARA